MLARKMFRDMKHNFGQFFSVFILAMLAMAMNVTFEGHVLSEENEEKYSIKNVILQICGCMAKVSVKNS